ncbi:unnamed protein product [Bursaphelenchus okinawaensis]|uniref:Uncharacterized protein n=1 Tax=Bursaphelenchus okinawaensis TaxID=465554 RepID=A0A811L5B8_9BILA|nr:unnamed protein product [Bursaphelenchus okinawaensis]CAG9116993.1 unnamed protein product [Bursaphelenchus okinawaensis]
MNPTTVLLFICAIVLTFVASSPVVNGPPHKLAMASKNSLAEAILPTRDMCYKDNFPCDILCWKTCFLQRKKCEAFECIGDECTLHCK